MHDSFVEVAVGVARCLLRPLVVPRLQAPDSPRGHAFGACQSK